MKKYLLLLLVLIGCTKQKTTQPNTTKMATIINEVLLQTGSNSTLLFQDNTGLGSSGNPNGWNYLTNATVGGITSVTGGGTYRAAPSNSAPVTIPTFTLMPTTPNPLPYVIGQQFLVTPAMMGFTSPTFSDGLYQMTYTVTAYTIYTITCSIASPSFNSVYSVGDPIFNVTTHKLLGTVQSATATVLVLNQITGNTVTSFDDLTNGITLVSLGSGTQVFGGQITLTAFPNCWLTVNLKCCFGKMSKLSSCDCSNEQLDRLRNLIFTCIQQSQCFQYNSALDTMFQAQLICNTSGCNC